MPTAAATLRRPDGVDRRPVERRAQGAAARERADDEAVVQDADGLGARADDQVERVAGALDVVRVDGCRPPARQVAQARVGQRGAEPRRGDDSQDVVDVQVARRRSATTMPWPSVAGSRRAASATVASGGRTSGVSHAHRLVLDPADRGIQLLQRHVLRQHAEPAAAGERRRQSGAGDRVHVRRDERDRRGGAVARREVDVEPARDGRVSRDEEDVRVGQVDVGLLTVELHTRKVSDSCCADNDAQLCSPCPFGPGEPPARLG